MTDQTTVTRRSANFTPTRKFLLELGAKLERIADGAVQPLGMGELLVLRKALGEAIPRWRPEDPDDVLREVLRRAADDRDALKQQQ
jgi:hypothetical protein